MLGALEVVHRTESAQYLIDFSLSAADSELAANLDWTITAFQVVLSKSFTSKTSCIVAFLCLLYMAAQYCNPTLGLAKVCMPGLAYDSKYYIKVTVCIKKVCFIPFHSIS